MKKLIIFIPIICFFIAGCCHTCVNNHQAEKSKIEAKKAMDEMDAEKNKGDNQ